MRRFLTFTCEGETLAATLDEAAGSTGLLIVSGGNEIRIGAHRGMAKLARDVAQAGFPVFRFDRRGIGDSSGENGGFRSSGPDIEAAISAFRSECPSIEHLVCFGNCDAATALVLTEPPVKHLVLANPWVFEPTSDLPPPAAIKARYRERLLDPKAWLRLISGKIDLRKAYRGIADIAAPKKENSLAQEFAASLSLTERRGAKLTFILATGDATAIAFKAACEPARCLKDPFEWIEIESNSHSFASDADYAVLKSALLRSL